MRSFSLPQLALSVRQRADLGGQQAAFGQNSQDNITDVEMTTYLNESVAELWQFLVEKFGDNYAYQTYPVPLVAGVYSYALPFDFYKELGLDLALSTTGNNWATVRPFTIRDRNQFSYPLWNVITFPGWAAFRWCIQNQQLVFTPAAGILPGMCRLLYVPTAPILVATLPGAHSINATVTQGQQVSVAVVDPVTSLSTNQVFVALNAGTTGSVAPSWNVPGTNLDNQVLWSYEGPASLFATTFDGIAGYESFVILDAAIKCSIKQEKDVSEMMTQRQAIVERINVAAANRSAGDPMCVSGGFGQLEGGIYGGFGFNDW